MRKLSFITKLLILFATALVSLTLIVPESISSQVEILASGQAKMSAKSENPTEELIMEYQGHNIHLVEGTEDKAQVVIDEIEIEILRDPTINRFSTLMMPYMDFENLEELAKKVIDNHPDFRR